MNGLTLLLWLLGLAFLYLCWRVAVAMDSEITPVDEQCAAIDREVDDSEAFYADLAKNVGV